MGTLDPAPAAQPGSASSGVAAVAEAFRQTGSFKSSVMSSPVLSGSSSGAASTTISFANASAEGGFLSGHSQHSFVGSESREARSRSFAMAPPTPSHRKASVPLSGSFRAAQRESVALYEGNGTPHAEVLEPEDGAVNAVEESATSDTSCSEVEDIVEYTVENSSGSQACVPSDDDSRVTALSEHEEGTDPDLCSSFDAPAEEKEESTLSLSPEDAYYEGQSHPRRRSASTDSAALVKHLSLSHISPAPVHSVVKAGFLKKRSPNPSVGWQKRWFVLKDKRLMYFRHADDVVPAGRIDLNLVKIKIQCVWDPRDFKCGLVSTMGSTVQLPQARGRNWVELLCCGGGGKNRFYATGRDPTDEVRCRLKPVGSTRAFELAGPYLELVDWIDKLSQIARDSRLNAHHVGSVSQQKGFWKVERISPVTFARIADTGDILLFRTKVLNAAFQRAITRGTYDHVALLLRSVDGQILILESMGDTGVILTPWDLFTKSDWFTAYRKIVLRRLRWPRTAEKLDHLSVFVKSVIGKDYELSIAKLISKRKSEQQGGYFCSELVAAALQEIGALPASAVSSRFWPESFAARSNLKLCDGYELEEELLVDFALAKHSGGRGSRKKERPPQLTGRTLRSTVTAAKAKDGDRLEKAPDVADGGVGAAQGNSEAGVDRVCQTAHILLAQPSSISNA